MVVGRPIDCPVVVIGLGPLTFSTPEGSALQPWGLVVSRTKFWQAFSSVQATSTKRFGDDDGEGNNGGDNDVQSKIDAAVAKATEGLKAKNAELLGESKKHKEAAAKASEMFESLGGEDGIKSLQDLQSQVDKDETLKLIKDGKWEEVLEQRTAAMSKKHEKQLEALTKERDEAVKGREDARQQRFDTLLEVDVRRAAGTSEGFQADAVTDVLFRAKSVFNAFNEETGQAEIHDSDGNPVLGDDGKSPITMDEWLEGQRDTARHWWASSRGSGASGSGNSGGSSDDVSKVTDFETYEKKRREQRSASRY